jgi:hypothetical protein
MAASQHARKPNWQRPGSPIGHRGPRKAHPKYKRNLNKGVDAGRYPHAARASPGKYTDRRHQLEDEANRAGDPQQSAARKNPAQADQPKPI